MIAGLGPLCLGFVGCILGFSALAVRWTKTQWKSIQHFIVVPQGRKYTNHVIVGHVVFHVLFFFRTPLKNIQRWEFPRTWQVNYLNYPRDLLQHPRLRTNLILCAWVNSPRCFGDQVAMNGMDDLLEFACTKFLMGPYSNFSSTNFRQQELEHNCADVRVWNEYVRLWKSPLLWVGFLDGSTNDITQISCRWCHLLVWTLLKIDQPNIPDLRSWYGENILVKIGYVQFSLELIFIPTSLVCNPL